MNAQKVAVINLGGGCEGRCYYCAVGKDSKKPTPAEMERSLAAALNEGAEKIVFVAGAASQKQNLKIVEQAKKAGGADIRFEICGANVREKGMLRSLARSGVSELCVTVPAASGAVGVQLSGLKDLPAKSFRAVKEAAAARGMRAQARIPVCEENARELIEMIDNAAAGGAESVILDAGETHFYWGREAARKILREVEKAVLHCSRKGLAVALKGAEVHQVSAFSDGRHDKSREDEHFLLTHYRPGRGKKKEVFSADLRITRQCNQNCIFCGVHGPSREPDHSRMRPRLKELLRNGLRRVCFEGGEPTLSERLPEYLRLASDAQVRDVSLMTNGVRASDAAFAKELWKAGANKIFVSLHASEARLSDFITNAEGTFEKTVQGIHNCLSTGAEVYLIYVLTSANLGDLPGYVRFVGREFKTTPILVSVATPYFSPSLPSDIIPKYSKLRPALGEAASIARGLGLSLSGMEEQHRPPECALPGAGGWFRNLFAPLSGGAEAEGFVKPSQCQTCDLAGSCPGVRDFYARAHGLGEIKPVKAVQ